MIIENRKLRLFAWLFVVATGNVLMSCTSDEERGNSVLDGTYPMTFVGQVFDRPLTRTTSEGSWDGTEKVAIQIGEEVKLYTADKNGGLTADEPFYWENKTEAVDVLAWYPCNEAEVPVSFSVQQDQNLENGYQHSDFMRARNHFSFSDQPTLDFYHLPAKVQLNLKAGEGVENEETIKDASISFVNMSLTSGELDMISGTVAQTSGNTEIVPLKFSGDKITEGYLQTVQALLVPQQMKGIPFIKIVINNVPAYYIPEEEEDANLQSGYLYVYNVTVNNKGEVEVSLAVSGPEWTPNGDEHLVTSRTCYTADDIKPGDFFYRSADGNSWLVSDGGLREVDNTTGEKVWETPSQTPADFKDGRAYIGVVFQTDPRRMSELEKSKGWTHGYVMALTNASAACTWGTVGEDEKTESQTGGINYFPNVTRNNTMYQDVDGYGKKMYIADNKLAGVTDVKETSYAAFYYSEYYGTGDSQIYAAPGKESNLTSGWYLPTIGQWWDILENLGEAVGLLGYRENTGSTVTLRSTGDIKMSTAIIKKLNERMGENNQGVAPFVEGVHYWSSSEKDKDNARRVLFDAAGTNNYSLRLSDNRKSNPSTVVRCILAF